MQKIKNYIGGEQVEPISGEYLPDYSPATGEPYASVPNSGARDVEQAIEAARRAFPAWSETSVSERAQWLRKIASGIETRKLDFARAESIDTGKPLTLAQSVDIPRSIQNFEFFADAISQFSSECHVTDPSILNYTLRSPLGVVGCISPWNLPLYLLTWKIAPALATGNTVVAKPSEVTPMTAYLLSEVCIEAGLPAGVLNIVHGLGNPVGQTLCQNPTVRAISFTGSTKTGSEIARMSAPVFKKLSLEMGGKNPCIIFSDAGFEDALSGTIRSMFFNQGQICLGSSRVFVERSLYPKFKEALIERTLALKIGDPLEPDTQQGSLVSQAHFDKVISHIELAKKEGGKILTGGSPMKLQGRCEKGWFVAPTIIEGLPMESQTHQEEIFGPVATLTPFDSEGEVLTWANQTRYGLAATLWTQNISRAHRLAGQLQAGLVWLNCWMVRDLRTPFGGMKDSGLGREGGLEALKFFTEPKNVCIKY